MTTDFDLKVLRRKLHVASEEYRVTLQEIAIASARVSDDWRQGRVSSQLGRLVRLANDAASQGEKVDRLRTQLREMTARLQFEAASANAVLGEGRN